MVITIIIDLIAYGSTRPDYYFVELQSASAREHKAEFNFQAFR